MTPSEPDAGSGQLVHISTPVVDRVMAAIIQAAENPAVDVAKMKELLALQKELMVMQAEQQFNEAMQAAQSEMPRVKKDGTIDLVTRDGISKGKIAFARFEDVDTVLRPIMTRHGFSVSFDMQPREGGGGVIVATLLHRMGHSKTAHMSLPLDTGPGRNNLQSMGSTLSYGKRYLVEMLFNVVREGVDDDGKSGGARYVTEAQAKELRALMALAKRQEGPFLDRLFGGSVHSCEEIEAGAFVVVKNTLASIIDQQAKKDQG